MVGSPLALSAATRALGPGTGTTGIPLRRQARTSLNPGSLIPGVPASLTRARDLPSASMPANRSAASTSLCSW